MTIFDIKKLCIYLSFPVQLHQVTTFYIWISAFIQLYYSTMFAHSTLLCFTHTVKILISPKMFEWPRSWGMREQPWTRRGSCGRSRLTPSRYPRWIIFYPLLYFVLVFVQNHTTTGNLVIVNFPEEGCEESSVPDPWHFGMDPYLHSRVCISDWRFRIRILLFSSVTFNTNNFFYKCFLLITFWRYIYILFHR